MQKEKIVAFIHRIIRVQMVIKGIVTKNPQNRNLRSYFEDFFFPYSQYLWSSKQKPIRIPGWSWVSACSGRKVWGLNPSVQRWFCSRLNNPWAAEEKKSRHQREEGEAISPFWTCTYPVIPVGAVLLLWSPFGTFGGFQVEVMVEVFHPKTPLKRRKQEEMKKDLWNVSTFKKTKTNKWFWEDGRIKNSPHPFAISGFPLVLENSRSLFPQVSD